MLSRQVTLSGSPELSPARACHGRLCVRHLARLRRADDRRLRPDRFRGLGLCALIADFLPAIVIGIAASSLVDRLPRRRLMIASDLARVAIFAVLPFANDPGTIVALAALAGFATGLRPALYAGLPNLVPDEDLPHANSLLQTIENVAWASAPSWEACSLQPRGFRGVLDQFRHVPRLGRPPRGHSGPAAAVGPARGGATGATSPTASSSSGTRVRS